MKNAIHKSMFTKIVITGLLLLRISNHWCRHRLQQRCQPARFLGPERVPHCTSNRGDKTNVALRFRAWLTVRSRGHCECPAVRHLGYKHRPGGFGDSRHNVTGRAGQEAAVSDTERDQAGDRVQFGRGNLRRTRVVRENQRACVCLSLEPRGP